MKGVLQNIINDVFNGTFVWRYLGLSIQLFRPIQLNAMGHTCVPHLTEVLLECWFVVCSLAHAVTIGSELSDMINALQAFEYHVAAELWLQLTTCRGILWDSACQRNRSRRPQTAKRANPPFKYSFSNKVTFGFGSTNHFSILPLIKPCQRNKSMWFH